jgi:hypothetical protein
MGIADLLPVPFAEPVNRPGQKLRSGVGSVSLAIELEVPEAELSTEIHHHASVGEEGGNPLCGFAMGEGEKNKLHLPLKRLRGEIPYLHREGGRGGSEGREEGGAGSMGSASDEVGEVKAGVVEEPAQKLSPRVPGDPHNRCPDPHVREGFSVAKILFLRTTRIASPPIAGYMIAI